MEEYSELIICGKAIRQYSQLYEDVIFTYTTVAITKKIKGNELNEITIVQTGGTFNTITQNASDITLMEIGKEYLLYLFEGDGTSTVDQGEIYGIVGGNQGIAQIETLNEKQMLISQCGNNTSRSLLGEANNHSSIIQRSISSGLPIHWNSNGYQWNKTTINIYISSSIYSDYGSTISAKIPVAIRKWNNCGYTLSISDSHSTTYDVAVFANNYGTACGWDGQMVVINEAPLREKVQLNASTLGSTLNKWQAVTCHEFGHVLGLDHVDSGSEVVSIMHSSTNDYYSQGWYTPQTKDREAVSYLAEQEY